MRETLQNLTAFLTGLLFAAGLVVGGMTQPAKVVGFLDFTGAWDPSLAFVMLGAVAIHFVVYRLVFRMKSPWLARRFGIPTRRDINPRLVGGAALFGLGWGLAGYCPGPGLVASGTGYSTPLFFVGSMLVGMLTYQWVDGWLQRLKASAKKAPQTEPATRVSTEGAR